MPRAGGGRLDAESETLIPTIGGGFDVAHALTGEGFDASEDGTGRGTPLIPIDMRQASRGATMTNNRAEGSSGAPTLDKGKSDGMSVHSGMQVRRLTPLETERLQGFKDGYTAIPVKGKPAADGPRYKSHGNSWAINCPRWIGERIEAVEAIQALKEAA